MSTQMSSPERIMACLQLKEPDRLPVIPVLMTRAIKELPGVSAADAQHNPELMAAAKLRALEKYGGDAVLCGTDLFVEVESLGAKLDYLPTAQPSLLEHPIQHQAQLEGLAFHPERGRARNVTQELKLVAQATKGSKIIGVPICGPFTMASLLVGTSNFFDILQDDEPYAMALLRVSTDAIKAYATLLLEAGAQAVAMLDPLSSSSVVSKETYLQFSNPFQREVIGHIGAHGGAPLLHICTHTEPIWNDMASTGAIGLHGDFWPGMDKAKQAIGSRVALFGSVNPHNTLIHGSPDDVRRECLALACRVGYNGGFILAAGCDTDWSVPDENIYAMVRAAEQVVYPFDSHQFDKDIADVYLSGEFETKQKQSTHALGVELVGKLTPEQEILRGLCDAVFDADGVRARELTQQGLTLDISPTKLLFDGLCEGMQKCGAAFERNERFVVDLLKSTKAMDQALKVLTPHIQKVSLRANGFKPKVVLGLARGNTQDIGKNLVGMMLSVNGFQVIDLGKNVPPEQFVEVAVREAAQIIAISVMTNSSVPYVEKTVKLLEGKGLRQKYDVLIGGAAASPKVASDLGISYGVDAMAAVEYARRFERTHPS